MESLSEHHLKCIGTLARKNSQYSLNINGNEIKEKSEFYNYEKDYTIDEFKFSHEGFIRRFHVKENSLWYELYE